MLYRQLPSSVNLDAKIPMSSCRVNYAEIKEKEMKEHAVDVEERGKENSRILSYITA